jgi:radical SAM superfamily enzyme YgiQ (UPF0313 family)
MKILLVYPQYPDTFWSFKHSLSFVRKKALLPPLGLLTVASMFPESWEKKLIDLNIEELKDQDLLWADYVCISAMITQKESVKQIAKRCKNLGVKTVAGGPLFCNLYHEFPEIDYFTLDEGELTLTEFLEDIKKGTPKKIYRSEIKPDLSLTPIPMWSLVKQKTYMRMPIQYSRGCPYDCEFCDVVRLNGKVPRTKCPEQIIKELDALYESGWNGPIFFVDDNFIGNKIESKKLLRKLAEWRKERNIKSTFMTEASLNISDDEELMALMTEAGFNSLFIGLETPSEASLAECGKFQNKNRNVIDSVLTLYRNGFEVSAGFIVGFDNDDTGIFKRQIEFIQKTGVVIAMIGLLQALPGTRLYERLKKENRLLLNSSGNNTDFSINFVPKIDVDILVNGYKNIISTVYSKKEYYARVMTFIKNYNHFVDEAFNFDSLFAFCKSIIFMGIFDASRFYYWKGFFTSLFKYPRGFTKFISMSIYYAHFKKVLLNYAEAK